MAYHRHVRSLDLVASLVVGLASLSASCTPAPPPAPAAPAVTAPVVTASPPDAMPEAARPKAPPGTVTTIAELLRSKPTGGRFTVTGFTHPAHHCLPCAPFGSCSRCADALWLSDSQGAGIVAALRLEMDLLVHVPDASRFAFRAAHQLTVEVGPRVDPDTARHELHLRDSAPVRPGG